MSQSKTSLESVNTPIGGTASEATDDTQPAGGPVAAPAPRASKLRLAVDQLPSGSKLDRYIVLDAIGVGGMGIVYAAYDPKLDRRVAIKVLRPEISHLSGLAESLIREARVMARLSHPNVCTVYEAGTVDDRVFIAMEYVDGETLAEWLKSEPRTWQDIVEAMLAAGRGLHAAHRAGIVHRDFKPANIMIDREKRVRVMDFGVAARSATQSSSASPAAGESAARPAGKRHTESSSPASSLVGTIGFMAPEQLRDLPADERSDQFAFCVTLYKALYGRLPYPGKQLKDVRAAFEHGRVADAPDKSRVPRWLRRKLLRGLAIDKNQRYPSVGALIASIEAVPRRRRSWLITGILAALFLLAIVITAVLTRAGSPAPAVHCDSGRARVAEIWSAERRARIEQAFADTDLEYSPRQFERVSAVLDRYAGEWSAMHEDACQATYVRGEQSDAMLDRRMFCLDGRLQQLDALAALLEHADGKLARRAVEAALSLGEVDDCGAHESLLSAAPMPREEDSIERIEAVRERLARVKALVDAGRYPEARPLAEALAEEASAAGYPPVAGEVWLLLGTLRGEMGDFDGSEQALVQAVAQAELGRDDPVRARALAELVYYVGWGKAEYHTGMSWARVANAVIERMGGDPRLQARVWRSVGTVHWAAGEERATYEAHSRALALREQVLGPEHPETLESMGQVGGSGVKLGRHEQALELHRRALDTARRVLGDEHPLVADCLNFLGTTYGELGELERAHEYFTQARDIWELVLGPEHPKLAMALSNLASLALADEDYDQAIELYQRVLAIETRSLGPHHANIAITATNMGIIYLADDDAKAALPLLERAYEILGERQSIDSAATGFAYARALAATGDMVRALPIARAARALYETRAAEFPDELAEIDAWLAQAR